MTGIGQAYEVFAGIFGVLAVASVTGFVLDRLHRGRPLHPTIQNLNARIRAWWVMVVLIGIAFAFGAAGVIMLFGIRLVCGAARIHHPHADPPWRPHRAGAGFSCCAAGAILADLDQLVRALFDFHPRLVFLLLPVIAALRGDTGISSGALPRCNGG